MIDLKQAYYTTHHQNFPEDFIFDERLTEHYELVCFLSGTDCRMVLDGREFRLADGDVVFRRPGQTNVSYMPFESIQLQFDAGSDIGDALDKLNPHHRPSETRYYQGLFHRIYHETLRGNPYAHMLIEGKLLEIIYGLLNEKEHYKDEKLYTNNPEVTSLLQYMDRHLQRKFTVDDMASDVGISRRKVFSLFRKELGTTPSAHLTALRLNYASRMLIQSNMSVEEIAYRCGFENHTYFITVFKKHMGRTPAVFRKRITSTTS